MRPLRETVIPLSLAQLRTLDGCAKYDSRTSVESGPRRPVDMPLRRAHSRTTCGRALYRSRNASGIRPRSDTSRPRSRAQALIAAVSVCEDSLTSTAAFYCQMHRYRAKRACSSTARPPRSLDPRGIGSKGGVTPAIAASAHGPCIARASPENTRESSRGLERRPTWRQSRHLQCHDHFREPSRQVLAQGRRMPLPRNRIPRTVHTAVNTSPVRR